MLTKKDKKKRYNKYTKISKAHTFSALDWMNKTSAAAFEGGKAGGAISGIAGAVSGAINTGMEAAKLQGVEEAQADIDKQAAFQSTATTQDDLLAEMAGAGNIKSDYNHKDFMQSGGDFAKSMVSGALQGAASGASAGPWGAVAGAAASLISGAIGRGAASAKAKVEAAEKNQAAKEANQAKAQALTAKAGALDQAADARSLAAYYADGGAINSFPSSQFGSPVTEFNAGGSHEENPYDGIPQGIAPDGLPNLVEEGEVKFDNYIFSDRLMLTKDDKQKYKFLKGKTYADAAKRIKKDLGIDERPNDLIAKIDLEEQLNILSMLQEKERAKRGLRGENRMMYASGGHLFDGEKVQLFSDKNGQPIYVTNYGDINQDTWGNLGYPTYPGSYIELTPEQKANWPGDQNEIITVKGGKYLTKQGRLSVLNPNDPKSGIEPVADSEKYFRKIVPMPDILGADPAGGEGYVVSPDTLKRTEASLLEAGPGNSITTDDFNFSEPEIDTQANLMNKTWTSFLQAAPAIGNAIGALTQAFNKPDYKHAKELQKADGTFTPISYTPIIQRMTYTPFDTNYYGNKLAAQAGATRRAIREQTASNPYTATAALLAADANAQSQLGDLYKKAEEYNLAQREKVNAFNRATDQANAELAMKAQQLNAALQNSAYDRQFKRDAYAQQMKQAEDDAWSKAMSVNMTGLFDNLGAIGKERGSQIQALLKLFGDGVTYTEEMYPLLEQLFGKKQANALKAALSQIPKKEKKAYGGTIKRKRGYTI